MIVFSLFEVRNTGVNELTYHSSFLVLFVVMLVVVVRT